MNTKPATMLGAIGLRGWAMIVALAGLGLVPLLVEMTGNAFYLDLATRLVCLAIAAVSLNLILGYGGMISFGHAAYIGLGAYCVGIPAYYDYTSGFLQFPLAVGVSALFALITGALCLRTKGVYFIMITMAFSQMAFFLFVSLDEYGADDGLTIDYRSEFGGLVDVENNVTLYYVCFVSLLAAVYLVHRIVHSRFGMAIRGARGNEQRMRAIGYNTYV
ncbi:MAG: branched-chain amino acid ABC transporter permease, partial [Hyphomicrobiales bacterium]